MNIPLAHNKCYDKPDVENKFPPKNCCVDDEDCEELKTVLDVEKIALKLENVCISTDPGHYLCDFVFFKSLYSSKGRSLFIHVPPLNKPFTAEELANIIVKVLQEVLHQIH